LATIQTMQASKWTVRCWDASQQWVWLYTFSGDGRSRTGSVTWKDENNGMTGQGSWFLEGGKLKTTWTNSQTKETWALPINTENWTGSCTMHGKPYNLHAIARSVTEKKPSTDKSAINADLLFSGDKKQAAQFLSKRAIEYMPLEKAFGGPLKSVNGLAVHITAGRGQARDCFDIFTKRNVSTHFVIDRSGNVVQFVAASLEAWAQGPGNPHWLSVELVGYQPDNAIQRTEGIKPGPQLDALRDLWGWVRDAFPHVKEGLAIPYVGQKHMLEWVGKQSFVKKDEAGKPIFGGVLGMGLDQHYKALADAFVARGDAPTTSDNLRVCIDSLGLSCHWWLDYYPKSCPGAPIMSQMPEVLGKSAVVLPGAEKYLYEEPVKVAGGGGSKKG